MTNQTEDATFFVGLTTTHLAKKLSNTRKYKDLPWFRPHDKTQMSEDRLDDSADETRVMIEHVHGTNESLEPRKIHTVVTQRPLPTFQTVQKTVETTGQHHVDVPVVVQRRVTSVQRVKQRCSCRGTETDPHGPDSSEDHGDSTDAVY